MHLTNYLRYAIIQYTQSAKSTKVISTLHSKKGGVPSCKTLIMGTTLSERELVKRYGKKEGKILEFIRAHLPERAIGSLIEILWFNGLYYDEREDGRIVGICPEDFEDFVLFIRRILRSPQLRIIHQYSAAELKLCCFGKECVIRLRSLTADERKENPEDLTQAYLIIKSFDKPPRLDVSYMESPDSYAFRAAASLPEDASLQEILAEAAELAKQELG